MLIEFSVSNFASYKEKQTLSLLPSVRSREVSTLRAKKYAKLAVLPTIAIYGPNNSGKSNLIRAFKALDWLVLESGNFNSDRELTANDNFAFDVNYRADKPTLFEIEFVAKDDNRYRYIVEFDKKEIIREELYFYNVGDRKISLKKLFKRNGLIIDFGDLKGKRESISFQKNQLFLSRGDIEGNKNLQIVYSFFSKSIYPYSFTENEYTDFLTNAYKSYVNDKKNKESQMPRLIEMIIKEMDTGILGVETNMVDISKIVLPEGIPQETKDKIFNQLKDEFVTRHKVFDGEEEIDTATQPLAKQSLGTRKLLGLLPLIISSLAGGDTLIIDEMNTSIHTSLTMWIISLFNNEITNPNNAQLIMTTHDISLINKYLYDRDQIYVIEKDEYLASDLYSFADIKNIKKDKRLDDFYETGKLGGVPHVATAYLEGKINHFLTNENE